MADLTTLKEREALELFKERISDHLTQFNWYKGSDPWLVRWLRARELNVDKAEDMFRKSMAWRVDENMDKVMEWKVPEFIDKEFPMQAPGFDRDGCVVAIVPFGDWDVRKAVAIGMKKELLRYIDQIFENAMKFLESRSMPLNIQTQFILVLDFDRFSVKQLASKETIELVIEIIRRFEGNHPETLKSGWIVNAPKIFEILFALVKPLLTARTLNKVHVHGSNTEQWREALLKNIDADQLPSRYGGSILTIPNYKISHGFDISTNIETFPEEEMVCIIVDAGIKHSIEFCLSKGSTLTWNFRSLDYDIGFALTYEADDGANESRKLESCPRVDSHLYTQKGRVTAEECGKYYLVFDNSFSRFRSKTLLYGARLSSSTFV